jgi:putative ABC transport system permease protein
MSDTMQTICFASRLLWRSPGFTLTAIFILALGIGATTAIFSLTDAVILNPLPFPKPDQLIQITQPRANDGYWSPVDYPDFVDIQGAQRSFSSLAATSWSFLDLSGRGEAQRFTAIFTSADLFKLTQLPFVLGRPFTAEEDRPGGPLVVVLSDALWHSRFNSDPNIIGQNLTLSGKVLEVIGVCSRQVEDVSTPPTDVLYVPLHVLEIYAGSNLQQRGLHNLFCVARLKDQVTLPQAQAELQVIQENLVATYPDQHKGYGIHAARLLDSTTHSYSATVWLLGAAVGCLLLITCANISNLLVARSIERRREITIRATLGASRARVMRQLLAETAFLCLLGGIAGLFVASWAVGLIKVLSPPNLHRFQEVNLDERALFFVFGLTAIASLFSGFLPALRLSKSDLSSALKDEGGHGGTSGPQRQKAQQFLITAQIAFACVLLTGATLFGRSFLAEEELSLGFNPSHLLTANITPTDPKYNDVPRIRGLFDAILEKARRIPGVTGAAMNQEQPFEWTFGDFGVPFHVPGQAELDADKAPKMCMQPVSSDYFKTLQIPLLSGRDFDLNDQAGHENVAVIDNACAQRFFPNQDPIGKHIEDLEGSAGKLDLTIVGVVQNSRHNRPDNAPAEFQTFVPYSQYPNLYRQFLLLRTRGDPEALIPAVQRVVASVDPGIPVTWVQSFDSLISYRMATRRLGVVLVSLFSGLALFLSAVGLYAVLAYSVNQRNRELGIRIALGAGPSDIFRLVILQGFRLVCLGVVIGTASAFMLSQLAKSILFGVSTTDPVSLGIAVLVLGSTGILASLVPSLRAAHFNPASLLRE